MAVIWEAKGIEGRQMLMKGGCIGKSLCLHHFTYPNARQSTASDEDNFIRKNGLGAFDAHYFVHETSGGENLLICPNPVES